MKKNKVDVQKIINEIKDYLNNGTKMTYVNSLNIDKKYKEKEIKRLTRNIKIRNFKNKIKKLFY